MRRSRCWASSSSAFNADGLNDILSDSDGDLMGFLDWFRRFFKTNDVNSSPPDWTDNLSVSLRAGRTVDELVDCIFLAIEQSRKHEALIAELGLEFGLSHDDAEVAVDRVCGGIFRARTGNRANCPDRLKDPVAWVSFQHAMVKRSIKA